jgi:hypothetical protein
VPSLQISKSVALGLVALIIVSSVVASEFVTTGLQSSTSASSASSYSSSSSSSSSSSTSAGPSNCLAEIDDSTYLWPSRNSTTSGVVATFTNGTQRFFPDGQCPEPAQGDFYQLVTTIMSNPEFVAAENGSKFLFDEESSGVGISIGSLLSPDVYMTFFRWGNETTHPCGPQFGAVRAALARIDIHLQDGPEGAGPSHPSITVNSTLPPPKVACPLYGLPISTSYPLHSIPPTFTLGNATFKLVYNATGYDVSHNGTRTYNPGFTMVFNATEGIRYGLYRFFWPTSTPTGIPSPGDFVPSYPADMSWSLNGTEPYLNVTLPFPVSAGWNDSISMSGFSLCASDCGVQAPLLTGLLAVHSTSSLYSIRLVVNGTAQLGLTMPQSPLTIYTLPYRGGVSPTVVVKGDVYQVELVAKFRDGSTATAEALVTAN